MRVRANVTLLTHEVATNFSRKLVEIGILERRFLTTHRTLFHKTTPGLTRCPSHFINTGDRGPCHYEFDARSKESPAKKKERSEQPVMMTDGRPRYLRARGRKTVELPFLMSCALHLLDRRYWIVGVRYPWFGVRFDLVVLDPSLSAQTGLVEVKYRGDGRPVRPYEVERFREEVQRARSGATTYHGLAIFMTNTRLSKKARELAIGYGIRVLESVPVLFELSGAGKRKKKRMDREDEAVARRFQL